MITAFTTPGHSRCCTAWWLASRPSRQVSWRRWKTPVHGDRASLACNGLALRRIRAMKKLRQALAVYSAIKAAVTLTAISADIIRAYGEQPAARRTERFWGAVGTLDMRDYMTLSSIMNRFADED